MQLIGLFSTKSAGFIPNEDAGIFIMGVTLPEDASAARTDQFIDKVITTLQKKVPEIQNITSIAGINILNRSFKSNAGTFFVQLKNWEEREKDVPAILSLIRTEFAGDKDGNVLAVAPPPIPGLGISGGFSLLIEEQQAGDIKKKVFPFQ